MKSIGQITDGLALPKAPAGKGAGKCSHGVEIGRYCGPCVEADIQRERAQDMRQVAENRRQAELKSIVWHSGIPPRFRTKTFDTYRPEDKRQEAVLKVCRAYADRFVDRLAAGGGLIMAGKPGTGKTHLACAIANQLMESGRAVLFTSVLEAVRRVKETYSRESKETERQAIAKFFTPELLILDEVGLQLGSETERLILFEIINGRYERVLPTILLSNLDETDMAAFVGERVLDRMREGGGVVLAFDWESKRKDVKTASKDMPAWIEK